MSVRGLIEKRLGSSGRLNTVYKSDFSAVRIRTKEDNVIWTGDLCLEKDRNKLFEVARLSQKTLYIHRIDTDELIGKVHVQLSLFEED